MDTPLILFSWDIQRSWHIGPPGGRRALCGREWPATQYPDGLYPNWPRTCATIAALPFGTVCRGCSDNRPLTFR